MLETKEDISKIPMFFILGRERSGSTLLRTLLDAHPNITIPFESRFIQFLFYKYFHVKKWSRKTFINLHKDISENIEPINIDKVVLRDALVQMKEHADFSTVCKTSYVCVKSIFDKAQIKTIGDKNARYSFFIKNLLRIFPEAKFIHIVRDYRDSTLSFYKVKGRRTEKKNAAYLAYRWKYYNRQILKFKNKNPDRFFTIKYEDLVNFPEQKLSEICGFLHVDYTPAMLDYHVKVNEYFDISSREFKTIHSGMREPIDNKRIEIWKSLMREKDIKKSDVIAGRTAELLGYERKYKGNYLLLKLSLCFIITAAWFPLCMKKIFYQIPSLMRAYYDIKY
jgi:hypothetical protein